MRSAGAVRCMRRLSVKLMLPIFQSQFPIGCAEDRATLAIGNIGTGNTITLATFHIVSIDFGLRRNAFSPMYRMPFLSIHGFSKASPVMTTLRKESRTWRREYVSCLRFSASGMENADWKIWGHTLWGN